MAKSVLESTFRERLKNLPMASKQAKYKLNDKLAHREKRKIKKVTAEEKAEDRAKCRERVRLCHQRKKLEVQQGLDKLVLVPCNKASTEHWFLVALFPKQRWIAVFDSLAESGKLKAKVVHNWFIC